MTVFTVILALKLRCRSVQDEPFAFQRIQALVVVANIFLSHFQDRIKPPAKIVKCLHLNINQIII